ncbi:MAG: hypothetical protein Q9218_005574, partial [Villophora microphyllina]
MSKKVKVTGGCLSAPSSGPPTQENVSEPVENLIHFIFNHDYYDQILLSLGYDVKGLPVGKLSHRVIQRGYEILEGIGEILHEPTPDDPGMSAIRKQCLGEFTSQSYTMIPHIIERKTSPIIGNLAELKRHLTTLESLGNVKISDNLLDKTKACPGSTDETNKLLTKYYRWKPTLENTRRSRSTLLALKARHMLTAMSLSTSSQGLKIGPTHARHTGHAFGKGVYFAEMSSKSANHCHAKDSNNTALVLLYEVEMGNPMVTTKISDCDVLFAKDRAQARVKSMGRLSLLAEGMDIPGGWKDAGEIHADLKDVMM